MHVRSAPRRLLPVLLLLSFLAAAVAPLARPAAADGPTLPSYRIEAVVEYASATLQVTQEVRFRNQTGQTLDRAVFQVVPAYFGGFTLLAASAQGQPSTASLQGTVLDVPFSAPLAPGASVEIGLRYRLAVPPGPGRLSAGPSALALGNWFPALTPHRGDWDRHQYTDVGDAFVTELADFDLRLTTSIPVVVAASGRVLEDSGTSFRLQALNVRDFGLSLSPGYQVAETRVGDTLVRAYGSSPARSRVYADAAAKFLRWYSRRLAPYPYRTFNLAEVDLPASYGGMEYPGLIFLSSALGVPSPFEGSLVDTLIGHEVAHQWFYGLVGNDQIRDPWLDEAFATYLPYYYYRETSPALFEALWGPRVLAGLSGRASPAGGPPLDATTDDFPNDGPYFTAVYRQGARFLEDLRQRMGDAAFEAALGEMIGTFGDKLASPRAVLDIFQRNTPANLNPLISRYFTYGGFGDPTPPSWRVETPDGAWRGSAALFVGADFPVTWVEAWLDGRRLYAGEHNAVTLDLTGVEPDEYALLVRVSDHRGAQFERARRVAVAGS